MKLGVKNRFRMFPTITIPFEILSLLVCVLLNMNMTLVN